MQMQKTYSSVQFKHTAIWNDIIDHLRNNLETKRHRSGIIRYVDDSFTGSDFVDVLYEYLQTKQHQFEHKVTKDKVIKLSQSLMDSGLFESCIKSQLKFEDSHTRLFRFKEPKVPNLLIMSKKSKQKIFMDKSLLARMLENLREKTRLTQNDRHNTSLQRITREVILEQLLDLMDLPIIDQLLHESSDEDKENCIKNASIGILEQIFDMTKCENNEEWRKSALDCIENMIVDDYQLGNYKSLNDIELYQMIQKYYSLNSSKLFFFSSIYKPLFNNILVLIKHSYYYKALDIMNLGTLLLTLQKQAELKRLLKFIYLTSNNTSAPKLSEKKPNHIIVLNDYTECIFKSKLFSYEESRVLLNFMFNNFDQLFNLSLKLHQIIERRHNHALDKNGDQHLSDKQFCKRLSTREYEMIGKEDTTKCLVKLVNGLIDNVNVSLKEKKLRLKQLKQTHPEIYSQYFSNIF